MDYHHVHYPDDGTTVEKAKLGRSLWTARNISRTFCYATNAKFTYLETSHFGRLAFVEVGAMSVGRIVQIHPVDQPYKRGDEKSVFKFGGSAVIVFGEAGKWRPADDILQHTGDNVETLIRLGDVIARRPT